jgi:hypothetical protein
MGPLEQVTVLMTLIKRLGQVMDHERALLRSMKLDQLDEVQGEKLALAEAYEIELARLRSSPERLAGLEQGVRERLQESMRRLQDAVSANLHALAAAQLVIERILRNIADSLGREAGAAGYGQRGGGQVIPVAFNRKL